jgi:hypothetical protein
VRRDFRDAHEVFGSVDVVGTADVAAFDKRNEIGMRAKEGAGPEVPVRHGEDFGPVLAGDQDWIARPAAVGSNRDADAPRARAGNHAQAVSRIGASRRAQTATCTGASACTWTALYGRVSPVPGNRGSGFAGTAPIPDWAPGQVGVASVGCDQAPYARGADEGLVGQGDHGGAAFIRGQRAQSRKTCRQG